MYYSKHGVITAVVPWAWHGRQFTKSFDEDMHMAECLRGPRYLVRVVQCGTAAHGERYSSVDVSGVGGSQSLSL